MSLRINRGWILLMSCLALGACTTEKVIREVPAGNSFDAQQRPQSENPDDGTGQTSAIIDVAGTTTADSTLSSTLDQQVDGSNMVSNSAQVDAGLLTDGLSNMVLGTAQPTDIDGEDDDANAVTSAGNSNDEVDSVVDAGLSEQDASEHDSADREFTPHAQTISGEPGQAVDCQNTLPCSWFSADSQFTATVTSVDNIADDDTLLLYYNLGTLHDTEVFVSGGGQAVDAGGIEFDPREQLLAGSLGVNAQSLLAGDSLEGSVDFHRPSEASSLSRWSVSLIDGGMARVPVFNNLPIGTITSDYADCRGELPCIWRTPDGDVDIALTSAGGFTSNSRLSATFTVTSKNTIDVALQDGAMATGAEGTRFEGRTHRLADYSGYGKLTAEAYGGYPLSGSVDFYRNNASPMLLDELTLVLYQDDPVPRWNPRFVNVPLLP